jgi:hypothetical protein
MASNDTSGLIINLAMKIHNQLGPRRLEPIYPRILAYAL